MDLLRYGDCSFRVLWRGCTGAWVASVEGMRQPLSAKGATRWDAFAELNRRLVARLDAAADRGLMSEVAA